MTAEAVRVTIPALTYRLGPMLSDYASRLFGLPQGSYLFRSAPANEAMAFTPGAGTPCTTLSKAISRLARLLGPQPQGIRFSHHSTRRSLAQWMAFRGVPEATIMQLIGWRSDSIKRYYTPSVQSIIHTYGGSVDTGAIHAFFPTWVWPQEASDWLPRAYSGLAKPRSYRPSAGVVLKARSRTSGH